MRLGSSFLLSGVFHLGALALPLIFYEAADREQQIPAIVVNLVDDLHRAAAGKVRDSGRRGAGFTGRQRLKAQPESTERRREVLPQTEMTQTTNLSGEVSTQALPGAGVGENTAPLEDFPAYSFSTGSRGRGGWEISAGSSSGGEKGTASDSGGGGSGAALFINASDIYRQEPAYPTRAREESWEGTVILRVLVDPKGRPKFVELSRSSGFVILDRAAIETVKRWRFQPARSAGIAVEDWVRVPIEFRLADRRD